MFFDPLILRGACVAAVQNAYCYLVGTEFATVLEDSTNAGDLLVGRVSGPHIHTIIVIGKVQTEPQREIIPFNLTTQERDVRHRSITADDVSVDFTVKSRQGQGYQIHPYVVAEEPEVVLVQQNACCLHLNPVERILHELHEHTEVCQELPVLLRLSITRQHDGVTTVVPGKLQALEVVAEVQVEERQIIIHLILVGIAVHLADAKSTVIDALLVGDHYGQRLDFHNLFPPIILIFNAFPHIRTHILFAIYRLVFLPIGKPPIAFLYDMRA